MSRFIPCPFCGGTVTEHDKINGKHIRFCWHCNCSGPPKETIADALAAWDTRAADPSVLAIKEVLHGFIKWCEPFGDKHENLRKLSLQGLADAARAALASTPLRALAEADKWALLQASIDAVGKRMSGDTYLKTRAELLAASPKPHERKLSDAPPPPGMKRRYEEPEQLCSCKDRPASQCHEEWGPECSLGNSAEHAVRVSDERAAEIDVALGISLRVLAGNCHRFITVGDLKSAHFAINRLRLAAEAGIATPKPPVRKPLTEDVLRDAARYRFIRDADRSDFSFDTIFDTIMRYAMEDLDILVDEAIERERAHGIPTASSPRDGDRGEG